jgi:NAD-dependent SIR2 family protein deacetylase
MILTGKVVWARCLRATSQVKAKCLLSAVGQSDVEAELSPGQALYLWLADHMARRPLLLPECRELILGELAKDIVEYGNNLARELVKRDKKEVDKLPVCMIVVSNGTHLTMSGRAGFLSLATGEWVEGVKTFPAETLSYNLAGIYLEGSQALRGIQQP